MNHDSLNQSFDQIKKQAKEQQVEFEFSYTESEKFAATYDQRKLTKYSVGQSHGLQIRVISEAGVGAAKTENLSAEAIQNTFKEALQTAKDLSRERKTDPLLERIFKTENSVDLKMFDFKIGSVSIEDKLKRAFELEDICLNVDSRIKSAPYSGYSEFESTVLLLNSQGTFQKSESSGIYGYVYALAQEGESSKMSGTSEFHRTNSNYSSEVIAKKAAEKSLELLNSKQPKSRSYTVVLSSEVVTSLLSSMIDHLSADKFIEGTSLFKDKLNQKVFPDFISVKDDASQVAFSGAQSFDSEGTATKPITVIANGVIQNIYTNDFYSRKLARVNTGHAAVSRGKMSVSGTNLFMNAGPSTQAELLKSANEIIFIKKVDGLHSGLKESTLDFSLAAQGLLFKNGHFAYAVDQFVFSGNIISLFNQIIGMSNTLNGAGSSVQAPDLLIENVSVAGA